MRVVVAVEGEVTTRAAQSLATQPGIEVSLLGPSNSPQFDVVASAEGFDVVVGRDRAVEAATAVGIPAVTTGALHGHPGVAWCSLAGVALALAVGVDSPQVVAVAVPGEGGGDQHVTFPSPINRQPARHEPVGDRSVLVAPGSEPLGAALVTGGDMDRVIMDNHSFLEAVALAAGVGIWTENPNLGSVRVWDRSDDYLRTATAMGVVIAERPSAA